MWFCTFTLFATWFGAGTCIGAAGAAYERVYFTVGMMPVFLGMMGAVLIPEIADREFILVELGLELLPPIGMAIFVGALFSALMSSSDSALLAPASLLGFPFRRRRGGRFTDGHRGENEEMISPDDGRFVALARDLDLPTCVFGFAPLDRRVAMSRDDRC